MLTVCSFLLLAQTAFSPKLPDSIPVVDSAAVVREPFALRYIDVAEGTGVPAQTGQRYTVHYTGWLRDGKKFDSSRDRKDPFRFVQGKRQVIAGWESIREVPDQIGLPLIVKPPREGSSIGITKVRGYSQMQDAVQLATQYDPDVLCEEFIEGTELTCPVLGSGPAARALPVIRIAAPDGNYDYEHKYFSDDTAYHCPSGLPPDEEAEVQRLVVAAYRALGCRGWGRADLMRRASDGRFFLIEMNTSPGMTGHSLVPMSARAAGISYEQLCVQLLADAALDSGARLAKA